MNRISFFLTSIVMLLLSFSASADNFLRGDNNEDGKVNISDVTDLIDYLLTGQWTSSPYDEGFWVVFTDKYGNEDYYQLNQYGENTFFCDFDADGSMFDGYCPFHFRIDGVDYGAEYFLAEAMIGETFENPLLPGRNNYMIPVGLFMIRVVIDDGSHDHDYYVYVRPLYVVD